jgi:hypothetical protein
LRHFYFVEKKGDGIMPNLSQVHVNRPLTNMSTAYIQDKADFIADQVFPNIPVQNKSDRYFAYNKGDMMRDEAQVRAPASQSAGGDYDIDNTPSYSCTRWGFHKDVSDEEISNSDTPLDAQRDATQFVTQKLLIKKETIWQNTFFKAGIWGTDFSGLAEASAPTGNNLCFWDDYLNSAPILNIRTGKKLIKGNTAFEANTLVLGRDVFDKLCDHPLVLARIQYTQRAVATEEILASLFGVPKVLVANAVVNSANKGQTDNIGFLFSRSALLCYSEPNPGILKPSAGYTFSWKGLMGANAWGSNIKSFYMEKEEATRIDGQMYFDMKVIGNDLGVFYNDIISPPTD